LITESDNTKTSIIPETRGSLIVAIGAGVGGALVVVILLVIMVVVLVLVVSSKRRAEKSDQGTLRNLIRMYNYEAQYAKLDLITTIL
jgi:hypothetical protein